MTEFYRACLVFRHQTIFEMSSGKAAHLSVFDPARIAMLPSGIIPTGSDGEPDLSFLGAQHSDSVMQGIAKGLIHPTSLKEYLDPLDAVERPIQNMSRTKMSTLTTPSNKSTPSRGFRVLPAKQIATGLYRQAANLKSRLIRGPQSFNPRQIASQMITPSGKSTGRRSVVPATGSIWSSFKRPRKDGQSDDLQRPFGLGKEDVRKLTESVQRVGQKSVRRSEEGMPSAKRSRRNSSVKERNQRISPLLPKNSMKRFMNRFASPKGPRSSNALEPPKRNSSSDVKTSAVVGPAEDNESCGAVDMNVDESDAVENSEVVDVDNDEAVVKTNPKEQENCIIRSRFFAMGKRLTLPPATLAATARGRPLVREVADSVPKSPSPELFRKHARGRTVINKSLREEE